MFYWNLPNVFRFTELEVKEQYIGLKMMETIIT